MAGYRNDSGAAAVDLHDKVSLKTWRVLAAFAVAPLLAGLVFAVIEPLYGGLSYPERILRSALIYGLFGGVPATLVLGIPAFLVLKKFLAPTVVNCALAGAVVAAIP